VIQNYFQFSFPKILIRVFLSFLRNLLFVYLFLQIPLWTKTNHRPTLSVVHKMDQECLFMWSAKFKIFSHSVFGVFLEDGTWTLTAWHLIYNPAFLSDIKISTDICVMYMHHITGFVYFTNTSHQCFQLFARSVWDAESLMFILCFDILQMVYIIVPMTCEHTLFQELPLLVCINIHHFILPLSFCDTQDRLVIH